MRDVDEIDRKIIEELRKNSVIPTVKLARMVGLSNTACRERIKKLESSKIIQGYTIVTNQQDDDTAIVNFLLVETDPKGSRYYEEFGGFVKSIPEVISCLKILGKYDFLIKIVCKDQKTFSRVHKEIQDHPRCANPLTVTVVYVIK